MTNNNELILFDLVSLMLGKLSEKNVPLTGAEHQKITSSLDELIKNHQLQIIEKEI